MRHDRNARILIASIILLGIAYAALKIILWNEPPVTEVLYLEDVGVGDDSLALLRRQIALLEKADPVVNANVAFKKGDHRFVALPGAISHPVPPWEIDHPNVKWLLIAPDYRSGDLEMEWGHKQSELAWNYAATYNVRLKELMGN